MKIAQNAQTSAPKKVLAMKDEKVDVRDLLACNLCMDCVEACPQKPSPLKVEWEKNAFVMNIESTGALPPERVLKEATKILGKQLNEFEEQIKVGTTMRETKTTNPELIQLISLLKKESREKQAGIWLDVAEHLSKPSRQRIAVNLSKINRNTKRSDVIVVPGKILGVRQHRPCSNSCSIWCFRKSKRKACSCQSKIPVNSRACWKRILKAQT